MFLNACEMSSFAVGVIVKATSKLLKGFNRSFFIRQQVFCKLHLKDTVYETIRPIKWLKQLRLYINTNKNFSFV